MKQVVRKLRSATTNFKDNLARLVGRISPGKTPKVFGIGRNKTGTTSLQHGLTSLGYRVAPTRLGEKLLTDWVKCEYDSTIRLCRDFDAFQDIPFSLAGSHEILDKAFPQSKFVLTVRESEHQWFESLLRFHSKKFGNGNQPGWNDLESSRYRRVGFIAECQRATYEADVYGLYNPEHYKKVYLEQNRQAREYFADRPGDFLEINVAEPKAFGRLCNFLEIQTDATDFPWANKT